MAKLALTWSKYIFLLTLISHAHNTLANSSPSELKYNLLVAELAISRSDYDQALTYYTQALKLNIDPNLAETTVALAVHTQQLSQALQANQTWLNSDPGSLKALQSYIWISCQIPGQNFQTQINNLFKQQPQLAVQVLLNIHQNLPDHQQLSLIYHLDAFAKTNHKDAVAQLNMAEFSLQTRTRDITWKYLNLALLLKADLLDALELKAQLLSMYEGPSAELAFLRAQCQTLPQAHGLKLYYAKALIRAENYNFASPILQNLLTNPKYGLEASLLMSEIDTYKGQYALAIKRLMPWQDSEQQDIIAYKLAELHELLKQPLLAAKYYLRIKNGSNRAQAYLNAAQIYLEERKLTEAAQVLDDFVPNLLGEEKAWVFLKLQLFVAQAQYEQATRFLAKLSVSYPDDVDYLYQQALLVKKQGKENFSLILTKVLKLEPNHLDAQIQLAEFYLNKEQYLSAQAILKVALNNNPKQIQLLTLLSQSELKLKHWHQAAIIFKNMVSIDPKPEHYLKMGEALWLSGNKAQARSSWQQALKKYPNSPLLVKALQTHSLKSKL